MGSNVLKTLEEKIFSLGFQDCRFLLAVSAGLDSMVLLDAFKKLGFSFAVVHCNYGLRGSASDLDADLVRTYAEKNGIAFFQKSFFLQKNDLSQEHQNIQHHARNLRYTFFQEILDFFSYAYVVTAHHLEDQIETFFLHALRGSSVRGLAGMRTLNQNIFRPFLELSKQDLYQYTQEFSVPFREDESNFSNIYKRNLIRHQLLPTLKLVQENYLQTWGKTIQLLKEDLTFLNEKIEEIWQTIIFIEDKKWKIDLRNWNPQKEYVLKKKILENFTTNVTILNNLTTAIREKKIDRHFQKPKMYLGVEKLYIFLP